MHSSPESEASGSGTNFQGGQLSNDTSAQDEHEVDDTKVEPNSEIPRDAEAGDADAAATAAEWSDNNSDVFLSDTHTPSSSTPSSPPKFDEDILEADPWMMELPTPPKYVLSQIRLRNTMGK